MQTRRVENKLLCCRTVPLVCICVAKSIALLLSGVGACVRRKERPGTLVCWSSVAVVGVCALLLAVRKIPILCYHPVPLACVLRKLVGTRKYLVDVFEKLKMSMQSTSTAVAALQGHDMEL